MDSIDNCNFSRVHFVGIGGIGMSGIAKVLLQLGYKVSGSDLRSNGVIEQLKTMGAHIFCGHDAVNVEGADIVVVSSAVPESNPELVAARERGITIVPRGSMLSWLFNSRSGIAIAGTHGKTTTSSMTASVMEGCGLDPTVIVGGEIIALGSNAKLGHGAHLVAEADESDASFVELAPKIAVVTSVDADVNLATEAYNDCGYDHGATCNRVEHMFLRFMHRVSEDGLVVLCYDHLRLRELQAKVQRRVVTYGLNPAADLTVKDLVLENFMSRCIVVFKGRELGELCLGIPGRHNVQNALAVIAIGLELGLDFPAIARELTNFSGVRRRFQVLRHDEQLLIVDDYAHNPSKLKAAIHAAHTGTAKRVVAVFQPHRYTRTKYFQSEYATSFDEADLLLVTDIYAASEKPIPGISLDTVVAAVRSSAHAPQVVPVPTHDDVIRYLQENSRPGDIVIFLGAGDITKCAARAAAELKLVE